VAVRSDHAQEHRAEIAHGHPAHHLQCAPLRRRQFAGMPEARSRCAQNLGYIRYDSSRWLSLLTPIYLPSSRKGKRTEIQIFPDWDAEASKANCINGIFSIYGAGDGNRTHVRNLGSCRHLASETIPKWQNQCGGVHCRAPQPSECASPNVMCFIAVLLPHAHAFLGRIRLLDGVPTKVPTVGFSEKPRKGDNSLVSRGRDLNPRPADYETEPTDCTKLQHVASYRKLCGLQISQLAVSRKKLQEVTRVWRQFGDI